MTSKHATAVELLMSYPDPVVAEMLGVRLATIRRWMRMDSFTEALREREREQKASARRIARQAVVNAASTLCQAAGDSTKPDIKALLEVIKLSGALEAETQDPAEAFGEIIKLAAREEDEQLGRER